MRLVHLMYVIGLSLLAILSLLALDNVSEELRLLQESVAEWLVFLVFMLALFGAIALYRKIPIRQNDQDPDAWWRAHGPACIPIWTSLAMGGLGTILAAALGDMSEWTGGAMAGIMVLFLTWFRPSRLESTDRGQRTAV